MFSANSSQVSEDRLYVEDVFSTWLYTSTGSNQTITNGINLAGKGGMVLFKGRSGSGGSYGWGVFDTNRGIYNGLRTNTTDANLSDTTSLTSFNSNGFGIGIDNNVYVANAFSGGGSASWTFRKAPKFFDVVTWTGNSVYGTQIAHNLGVAPGCIIVKNTSTTSNWVVYHRSASTMYLNTTDAANSGLNATFFGDGTNAIAPTATNFTVGGAGAVNATGNTYVAYLFAHDTTSDGIIQCGSFTANSGADVSVNLGWEPQWVMIKASSTTGSWLMYDNMRGFVTDTSMASSSSAQLLANTAGAEGTTLGRGINQTGFSTAFGGTATYIYIAIRRGPMRTPTSGTSVFSPLAQAGGGTITTNFPTDLAFVAARNTGTGFGFQDRLRGFARELYSYSTSGEANNSPSGLNLNTSNTSYTDNAYSSGFNFVYESFRRAPGFFDVVAYTGTGVARTVNHNLGVAPEIIITKSRSNGALSWNTYVAPLGNTSALRLNTTDATLGGYWNSTSPTSSVFSLSSAQQVNENGGTYVAYLFASCPGVSKCGSYTGNGSSQTINCGFAAGARFILIKRTDSTGNWVTFDSARGIVSGNDPSLLLNSTAAETNYDDIDPDSSGFIVNQSTNNLNVSSAQYIYLAIS